MADTKTKISDSLRVPKPKKKLGLSVPPPLRMPHEDLIPDRAEQQQREINTSVSTPVTTPVPTPGPTPVATPVSTPVYTAPPTPATAAPPTPAMPPVPTGVSNNVRRARADLPFGKTGETYIDATHRASEQQIYSVMYRETISKGVSERYFGTSELMRRTGIRSDKTVRTALRGLREKLSIEIVAFSYGNPLGPRYRIYGPREILQRRRDAGIEIDPQSKQIITPVITGVPTGAVTGESTRVNTMGQNYRSAPAIPTAVTPVTFTGPIKYKKEDWSDDDNTPSSSSKSKPLSSDDDGASYLDSLRVLYEEITGNQWSPADAETAMRGTDVPLAIWGIALCFCVDRAPGNTFQRLAYVLEEARNHRENMKQYSSIELNAILRHNLKTLERVRASGGWARPLPEENEPI